MGFIIGVKVCIMAAAGPFGPIGSMGFDAVTLMVLESGAGRIGADGVCVTEYTCTGGWPGPKGGLATDAGVCDPEFGGPDCVEDGGAWAAGATCLYLELGEYAA